MHWKVDNITKKNEHTHTHTHIYIYTKAYFLKLNFFFKNQNSVWCTQNRKQLIIQTNQKVWVQVVRNINDNQ